MPDIKKQIEDKLVDLRNKTQVGDGPDGIRLCWRNEKDFAIEIGDKRYGFDGEGDPLAFVGSLDKQETVDEKMAKGAEASEKEEMESKGKPFREMEVKSASSPTVRSLKIFKEGEEVTEECSFEKTDRPSLKDLFHEKLKIADVENGNPILTDEAKELGYSFNIDENFPREKLKEKIKEPKIGKGKSKK